MIASQVQLGLRVRMIHASIFSGRFTDQGIGLIDSEIETSISSGRRYNRVWVRFGPTRRHLIVLSRLEVV
jgi:hypothetical protein